MGDNPSFSMRYRSGKDNAFYNSMVSNSVNGGEDAYQLSKYRVEVKPAFKTSVLGMKMKSWQSAVPWLLLHTSNTPFRYTAMSLLPSSSSECESYFRFRICDAIGSKGFQFKRISNTHGTAFVMHTRNPLEVVLGQVEAVEHHCLFHFYTTSKQSTHPMNSGTGSQADKDVAETFKRSICKKIEQKPDLTFGIIFHLFSNKLATRM